VNRLAGDNKSHYPNFDVMREAEHWDPHTREIVTDRLAPETFSPHRFLTEHEGDTLLRLSAIMLDDERSPVLTYVVYHFDATLHADIGQAQRKKGVPKRSVVVRDGLAWLDAYCSDLFGGPFAALTQDVQQKAVRQLTEDGIDLKVGDAAMSSGEWMADMLSEAVAAYYSHPSIWSEIGYAGPAYPRGYVRSEFGLTDPWEARRDGQS
jgi:hypothetical protein